MLNESVKSITKEDVTTLHFSNSDFWSLFFLSAGNRVIGNYNDNACLIEAATSASASLVYSLAGTLPQTGAGHATSE